jgi:hypothetical protein
MVAHDAVGDRQSEPGTLGLRGEEGVEDFRQDLRRDPRSRIADDQLGASGLPRYRPGLDADLAFALHRVSGIREQVHHDLLQRVRVAPDRRQVGCEDLPEPDTALADRLVDEQQRLVDDAVQVDASGLARRGAREREQPLRDARDALCMAMDDP